MGGRGPAMSMGGSPPGPDLVLTPPSGSGGAWAPSSSFSRFCSRTRGSGLTGLRPFLPPCPGERAKPAPHWISQPSHMVSVKQYRMPGKGKRVEGKVSVLIKELVETGVLKKPIHHIAQTALPLGPVNPNETVALHVSVTDYYINWHLWQKDMATKQKHFGVLDMMHMLEYGYI